ncbi:MAG TPA: helix-turn-helix domain-containing protein [Candidatus Paceibacterota bacterium]
MESNLIPPLKEAGLNPKSAAIYALLIEKGGGFPSHISKETRLNRSTVYKILTDLSIKGLVSEIEKGKKLYYKANQPQKLLSFARRQKEKADESFEKAKKLIPELEGVFESLPNKPKITYYEGHEGVVSVFEDHINVKKKYEMLGLSNVSGLLDFMPKKFFERYRRTKEKIGITTRGILPNTKTDLAFVGNIYAGFKKEIVPVVRHMSADQFPFKGEVTVYAENRVSIVNFEERNPIGIIIEDQTIHNMMRFFFELAWKGLK